MAALRRAPSVHQLLASSLLADGTLLGGSNGTGAPATAVRALSGTAIPPGTEVGTVLVLVGVSGYHLEQMLPRARAAGVVLVVTFEPARQIMQSTRWLADRLRLPLVSVSAQTPDGDATLVAQRLHALVSEDTTRRGALCAKVAADLSRTDGSPRQVLAVIDATFGTRSGVVGPEGVVAGVASPCVGPAVGAYGVEIVRDAEATSVVLPVVPRAVSGPRLRLAACTGDIPDTEIQDVAAALPIAAWALAAWSATHRLDAALDTAFHAVVLSELLSLGGEVPTQTRELALQAGWELDGWHTGIRILPLEPEVRRGQVVTSGLARTLRTHGVDGPVVELGDGWAVWLTQAQEPTRDASRRLIRAITATLKSYPALALVAGVGRPQPGPPGLAATLGEAWDLAQLAGTGAGRRRVEHAGPAEPRRLVLEATTGQRTIEKARRLLGPLVDEPTLLKTLTVYLARESSAASTAQRLGVHRNTVIKRLERIERLLDLPMDNDEIRLALRIACYAVNQTM